MNPLSKRGFATNVRLRKDRPFTVRYIMGMATIPNGFDIVKKIQPTKDGQVRLLAQSGKGAMANVDASFLYE